MTDWMKGARQKKRQKRTKKNVLLPCQTAKTSEELDPFLQIGQSVFTHPKFTRLKLSSQLVYERMVFAYQIARADSMKKAKGNQRDIITFPFPERDFKKYGFSSTTARAAINELIEAGFIVRKESGKYTRTDNKYQMVNLWKQDG